MFVIVPVKLIEEKKGDGDRIERLSVPSEVARNVLKAEEESDVYEYKYYEWRDTSYQAINKLSERLGLNLVRFVTCESDDPGLIGYAVAQKRSPAGTKDDHNHSDPYHKYTVLSFPYPTIDDPELTRILFCCKMERSSDFKITFGTIRDVINIISERFDTSSIINIIENKGSHEILKHRIEAIVLEKLEQNSIFQDAVCQALDEVVEPEQHLLLSQRLETFTVR